MTASNTKFIRAITGFFKLDMYFGKRMLDVATTIRKNMTTITKQIFIIRVIGNMSNINSKSQCNLHNGGLTV